MPKAWPTSAAGRAGQAYVAASNAAGCGGNAWRRNRGVRISTIPTIANEMNSVAGRPTRMSSQTSFAASATSSGVVRKRPGESVVRVLPAVASPLDALGGACLDPWEGSGSEEGGRESPEEAETGDSPSRRGGQRRTRSGPQREMTQIPYVTIGAQRLSSPHIRQGGFWSSG